MKCYLSLGSNLGNRWQYLQDAVQKIEVLIGECSQKSAIYESMPWGKTDQTWFLNQVLEVQTDLLPLAVLEQCLAIENQLDRQRIEKWGARTMDIDVLFYEDLMIDTNRLKVPHPYISERRFVLEPLHEIAPNFQHPIIKQTIQYLLDNCTDALEVKVFNKIE